MNELFNNIFGEKRNDEQIIDGKPYCMKCGGARFIELGDGDDFIIKRCACSCQAEGWESEQIARDQQIAFDKFKERQRLSMVGERYLDASFSNSKITSKNSKAFGIIKNYVNNSEEMKKLNIGLYIYGKNGVGKTHLIACMCNELVKKGYRCIYTSFTNIMTQIQKSYKSGNLDESTIIELLSYQDFLFIDDIAKEMLKGQVQGSFAEKVLYEVINARYNNKLPTIFTSNFSLTDLLSFGLDNSINSRIIDMANITIELKGEDLRGNIDEEKVNAINKLKR